MGDTSKLPAVEMVCRPIQCDIVKEMQSADERLTAERSSSNIGFRCAPVQETIRRLTREGFMPRQGGYTKRVAGCSDDKMKQAFDLRQMLEGYACDRAAAKAKDEEIEEIVRYSETIVRHTPPETHEDYARFAEADELFHHDVGDAARSPRLTESTTMALDVGMVVRSYRRYKNEELTGSAGHHHEIA